MNTHSITVDALSRLSERAERVIKSFQDASISETGSSEREQRKYTITEAARMVGKTPEGIRNAEKNGNLPMPEKDARGRRTPYTLNQINTMRDYWQCRPGKQTNDEPIRFSFQNFKGGVGKTTLSVACAQYLAQAGYRVLLIDCDSQASTTMTFGITPDKELEGNQTLLPFLYGEADSLHYAIRGTHWPGLDLIPANLELYSAEYYLASIGGTNEGEGWIDRLDEGITTVENDYDIVMIDPPPALGMISLSALRALDGLIVPTPPAMYDFHSTSSFLVMLEEVMTQIQESLGEPIELDFLKVAVSKKMPGRQAHDFVHDVMNSIFEKDMLQNPLVLSAEIDNAGSAWQTVYDQNGPGGSRETYKRCLKAMDAVFAEVRALLEDVWEARRREQRMDSIGSENPERAGQREYQTA